MLKPPLRSIFFSAPLPLVSIFILSTTLPFLVAKCSFSNQRIFYERCPSSPFPFPPGPLSPLAPLLAQRRHGGHREGFFFLETKKKSLSSVPEFLFFLQRPPCFPHNFLAAVLSQKSRHVTRRALKYSNPAFSRTGRLLSVQLSLVILSRSLEKRSYRRES